MTFKQCDIFLSLVLLFILIMGGFAFYREIILQEPLHKDPPSTIIDQKNSWLISCNWILNLYNSLYTVITNKRKLKYERQWND